MCALSTGQSPSVDDALDALCEARPLGLVTIRSGMRTNQYAAALLMLFDTLVLWAMATDEGVVPTEMLDGHLTSYPDGHTL